MTDRGKKITNKERTGIGQELGNNHVGEGLGKILIEGDIRAGKRLGKIARNHALPTRIEWTRCSLEPRTRRVSGKKARFEKMCNMGNGKGGDDGARSRGGPAI